jgi:hypothetical protein
MRILPDTRDLINLTERGQPVTADDFRQYLEEHNHQIVLSFTNIRELAGPLARGGDFLKIRKLLQAVEAMPHAYIKEVSVIDLEIQAAVEGFTRGVEYQDVAIYVNRWDATLRLPPGQVRALYERFVGLRLDNIVHDAYRNRPEIFAQPEQHLPLLQRTFEEDRNRLAKGEAAPRNHFVNVFRRQAQSSQIALPRGREEEISKWVYQDPSRCPGLRLHHETYRQLMLNYSNQPEVGDFSDLAHVYSLPYVDAATLDNRMRNYCSQACRKLASIAKPVDYRPRLYKNLADFMQKNS